jgi:hypothetical protein
MAEESLVCRIDRSDYRIVINEDGQSGSVYCVDYAISTVQGFGWDLMFEFRGHYDEGFVWSDPRGFLETSGSLGGVEEMCKLMRYVVCRVETLFKYNNKHNLDFINGPGDLSMNPSSDDFPWEIIEWTGRQDG